MCAATSKCAPSAAQVMRVDGDGLEVGRAGWKLKTNGRRLIVHHHTSAACQRAGVANRVNVKVISPMQHLTAHAHVIVVKRWKRTRHIIIAHAEHIRHRVILSPVVGVACRMITIKKSSGANTLVADILVYDRATISYSRYMMHCSKSQAQKLHNKSHTIIIKGYLKNP